MNIIFLFFPFFFSTALAFATNLVNPVKSPVNEGLNTQNRISSPQAEVLALVQQKQLAKDIQWQNLLHFKPTFLGLGPLESQIQSRSFFVSSQGKKNLQAELTAFIEGLFQTPIDSSELESMQCRFPARYSYLKTRLPEFHHWPDRPCPRFDKWFAALRGNSISLVFSSYYLNNPSSSFGHTLLRMNKAPSERDGRRYELLDYGVNYAANANTKNPLIYTFKGLFGGFPGTFTTVPYYYKVREYNNAESRDLWEYELSLKPAVVDMLVAHIWEVGPTYANYWYLTENCSYHMFTILEAADPELKLTEHLKKYVIPPDTVQVAMDSPGLVRSLHFRPSVRTELFERLKSLNENEKEILYQAVKQKSVTTELTSLPEPRRKLVLDAAIDDVDYLYAVNVQNPVSLEAQYKTLLLSARSKIEETTPPLNIIPSPRNIPHLAHGSRRIGLGAFDRKLDGSGLLLEYKFAMHDLDEYLVGYPESAQINFFDFHFAYFTKNQQLSLENFILFEVISLPPYSRFSQTKSWRLHVGSERLINEECMGCIATQMSGGAGYTAQLLGGADTGLSLLGYLGLKGGVYYTSQGGDVASGDAFPRWLVGAGPNLLIKSIWSDHFISLFEAWYRKDLRVNYNDFKEVSFSTQWSPNKTWAMRVKGAEHWFEQSAQIEFFFYY
jgi:hypothetical protein